MTTSGLNDIFQPSRPEVRRVRGKRRYGEGYMDTRNNITKKTLPRQTSNLAPSTSISSHTRRHAIQIKDKEYRLPLFLVSSNRTHPIPSHHRFKLATGFPPSPPSASPSLSSRTLNRSNNKHPHSLAPHLRVLNNDL